jgi:hypothetical protein
MRADTRPPLLASKLPAWRLNIRPGRATLFICPECETVPSVERGQIAPHRHRDGQPCTYSRRHLVIDQPYAALEHRQIGARSNAATRRSMRAHREPSVPVSVPVHRLAAIQR